MKKNIFATIIITILITLVLTGCKANPDGGKGGIGGNGIIMKWVNNMPPTQIYDDQPFEVAMEVENNGATPISGTSKVYLSGFSKERITGIEINGLPMPELEAQTQYTDGGKDIVTFKGTINTLTTANQYNIPLTATACYEYTTEAGGTICIDPNPYSTDNRKKSCAAGVTGLGAQGAPIKITSITTESSNKKTRLTITISNTGGGDIYPVTRLDYCSPYNNEKPSYAEQNIITVESIKIGTKELKQECTGMTSGKARLIGGKVQIRCSYDVTDQTTEYTDQVYVKVSYGYRTIIQKNVVILPTKEGTTPRV